MQTHADKKTETKQDIFLPEWAWDYLYNCQKAWVEKNHPESELLVDTKLQIPINGFQVVKNGHCITFKKEK